MAGRLGRVHYQVGHLRQVLRGEHAEVGIGGVGLAAAAGPDSTLYLSISVSLLEESHEKSHAGCILH